LHKSGKQYIFHQRWQRWSKLAALSALIYLYQAIEMNNIDAIQLDGW